MQKRQTWSANSPATASIAASGIIFRDLAAYDNIAVIATVTGGTGGATSLCFQVSYDGGTTFWDWARTLDVAAGATKLYKLTPSLDNKAVEVATGATPVIAKGTVVPGSWGDVMRVLVEAGTGTSAGALQSAELVGTFERYR